MSAKTNHNRLTDPAYDNDYQHGVADCMFGRPYRAWLAGQSAGYRDGYRAEQQRKQANQ